MILLIRPCHFVDDNYPLNIAIFHGNVRFSEGRWAFYRDVAGEGFLHGVQGAPAGGTGKRFGFGSDTMVIGILKGFFYGDFLKGIFQKYILINTHKILQIYFE